MRTTNTLISLAYRFDPGPIGGPGGVMNVQRELFGERLGDARLIYGFRDGESPFTRLPFTIPFVFSRFLRLVADSCRHTLRFLLPHRGACFVCHELPCGVPLAALRREYALVYHYQGSYINERRVLGKPVNAFYQLVGDAIESIVLAQAKCIVFPSRGAVTAYTKTAHPRNTEIVERANRDGKVRVVYNTIRLESPPPAISCPIPHAWLSAKYRFLSVGRLTEAKGQDRVPEFLAAIEANGCSDFSWLCIGYGDNRARIEDNARTCGVASKVHFIEKLPHADVVGLLARANIYVMLHRLSIFDFATLEAMASGCAVVLSPIDGNQDFNVESNVVFWDSESSVTRLDDLLLNLDRFRNLNQLAFEKHFSPSAYRSSMGRLMEDLLSPRNSYE